MRVRRSFSVPFEYGRQAVVRLRWFAALTVLLAFSFLANSGEAGQVHACFTPEYHGGATCTEQIVSAIASARKSIFVQAYGFTSAPIAKALVGAHKRGIDVRVILDKSNVREGYSSATFLQHMGITPLIDSEHAIAHNKVMVIDAREVITGSFNFTKAAEEKNAENVVFIDDPAVATAYAQNWRDHAAHSVAANQTEPRGSVSPESKKTSPGAVVGNRKSHIYQWPGCPNYNDIAPYNRVEFPSAAAAEQAGYRAARNCP